MRVFSPVSTVTKSVKIDQETPELLVESEVATFFMAHIVVNFELQFHKGHRSS